MLTRPSIGGSNSTCGRGLEGPVLDSRRGKLLVDYKGLVVYPASRFGAQQKDKLRAVDDQRRRLANSAIYDLFRFRGDSRS